MASVSLHLEWAQHRPRGSELVAEAVCVWGEVNTSLNHKFQYIRADAEPETEGRKVLGSPVMLMPGPPGVPWV